MRTQIRYASCLSFIFSKRLPRKNPLQAQSTESFRIKGFRAKQPVEFYSNTCYEGVFNF